MGDQKIDQHEMFEYLVFPYWHLTLPIYSQMATNGNEMVPFNTFEYLVEEKMNTNILYKFQSHEFELKCYANSVVN